MGSNNEGRVLAEGGLARRRLAGEFALLLWATESPWRKVFGPSQDLWACGISQSTEFHSCL